MIYQHNTARLESWFHTNTDHSNQRHLLGAALLVDPVAPEGDLHFNSVVKGKHRRPAAEIRVKGSCFSTREVAMVAIVIFEEVLEQFDDTHWVEEKPPPSIPFFPTSLPPIHLSPIHRRWYSPL